MDLELTLNALAQLAGKVHVDVAHDGVEALDYLYRRHPHSHRAAEPPRLVLLDVKMPRMDGLEVLRAVKTDPQLKSTPVVMLTSSRQEKDLVESYAGGANAYVVKPVDTDEFAEIVGKTGQFWIGINEPVPDGTRNTRSP